MSELLRVEHLTKSFGGVSAVVDVSFNVAAGELLALIGPNGAGKSTCFNLLNGQLSPDSGRIFLGNDEITGSPPRRIWRLGVGRTFQVTQCYASMSVIENVQVALLSYHRRLFALWPRAAELYVEEATALLRLVGMEEQASRQCGILAYGDLKRVELAVALTNRPRLLLMDEPTAGMASRERRDLMALTAEIVRDRRIGVLFTEHDMDVVFGHADRVIVLDRGRVIAVGSPAVVRDDPAVREVYLGSWNPRVLPGVSRDAVFCGLVR
jgi:branched-chain amino acid transport system ATP-binding protein